MTAQNQSFTWLYISAGIVIGLLLMICCIKHKLRTRKKLAITKKTIKKTLEINEVKPHHLISDHTQSRLPLLHPPPLLLQPAISSPTATTTNTPFSPTPTFDQTSSLVDQTSDLVDEGDQNYNQLKTSQNIYSSNNLKAISMITTTSTRQASSSQPFATTNPNMTTEKRRPSWPSHFNQFDKSTSIKTISTDTGVGYTINVDKFNYPTLSRSKTCHTGLLFTTIQSKSLITNLNTTTYTKSKNNTDKQTFPVNKHGRYIYNTLCMSSQNIYPSSQCRCENIQPFINKSIENVSNFNAVDRNNVKYVKVDFKQEF